MEGNLILKQGSRIFQRMISFLLHCAQTNFWICRLWSPTLESSSGILDKKKGLWSRRRMFLLTEGPRLFYVDPKDKELKVGFPVLALFWMIEKSQFVYCRSAGSGSVYRIYETATRLKTTKFVCIIYLVFIVCLFMT